MVERFPHNKSYLTSKQSTSDYITCHHGLRAVIQSFRIIIHELH